MILASWIAGVIINIGRDVVRIKEKYSRGRRGAPAKGVGRATGARVQIPLSPLANLPVGEMLESQASLFFLGNIYPPQNFL